ncbi:polymorphic toxin-type HINT domain-containing protein [Actinoplanes sp. TRM 88003]|uniref:Polymorphic toxin-type HINT domain-containing protein n=1 Tax=Paractinoplanes aksuensis TaxID=2939490 RepID=A0ABT1DZY9_9ACTN|nr:polymorphic toxin-type HINT domain-containing protein [Actinoplanes aksuensis]MCO8275601.1 polymorphic toxin-type HINT domain-containing protein [Actinoplanes aksuensis]
MSIGRARWLAGFSAFLLVATLAPPADVPALADPGDVPKVSAGQAPQQRGVPAGAASDDAVAGNMRPPVVPPLVEAGGGAEKVGKAALARAADAAPGEAFVDVLLRPGFVVGDTSLVAYFNLKDRGFESWRVDLYDTESQTRQESAVLGLDQLGNDGCGDLRGFCKSLGAAEGWQLDAARSYFVTITALYPDGEVPSANSENAQPRTTVDPPAIPDRQAAGCGCSVALGMTDASQAVRATGVNTGTGGFTLNAGDLSMVSFGVPFSSGRAYSSLNTGASAFGPGWAWVYDMKVTATADGALVRAEDGSDTLFKTDGDSYVRPPGVRSTLRKAGTGWELVTRNNIVFAFDGQGRLVSILNPRQVGLRFAHTDTSITVTDASGRKAAVKLTGGLIQSITLPDSRKTQYFYTDGLLTKVIDAAGEVWQYKYGANRLLTQAIDPRKVVMLTNEYGVNGRIVRQLDALGAATTFEWNAAKQEARTVDADNVVVWDGYKGNVLLYTQRGNGDTNNHRYDGTLNRSLVVNGNQNQHESRYDAAGNRIEQFAPGKRFSEKTTYDARNNPTTHVDADGQTWKDEYNEFDELVRTTDPENHSITHTYDVRGLRLTTTDQRGKTTRYEPVADGVQNAGLTKASVSPEGRRIAYGYDKVGRRLTVTDPRGTVAGAKPENFTTRTVYDDLDRAVAVHSPGKRNPGVSEYDAAGRLKKTTTPGGVSVSYAYFDNNLPKATYEARRTLLYTYTAAGRRLTAAVDMKHEADLVTSWTYNAKGLIESVTSPRGNVPGATKADFTTTYKYDHNDNLIQMRRPYPNGQVAIKDFKVDDLDRSVETTDELGKTSSSQRSNSGQVTATRDSLGRTSSMTYDKAGRQTGITDSGGVETKSEYDEAGNKIKQISATGGVTTYTYTDDGLRESVTEPRGNVAGADQERFTSHFEYDPAGNPTRTIDALDNVTTAKYDALNRTVSSTDANGHVTRYTYNDDDQTRTVTAPNAEFDSDDPEEDSTLYAYGEDGALASVTDPKGNRSTVYYDEAGRLIRSTDPIGRSTYAKYDADSNRIQSLTLGEDEEFDDLSAKDLAKRTIVDEYDIVNRLARRTEGTGGPVYTWGYDAKDRTTSLGDPLGVREVVYDDEDQIRTITRKEAGRADERFAYEYDARGNVTSRQYPDGTTLSYGYDAASRITSLTAAGATWGFGYDVAGRRTSTTLPAATGLTETRVYDAAGRLTSIGTERTGEPLPGVQDPISKYDLTLDKVGNPSRVVTTRGGVAESVAYGYDEADQVISACYGVASCTDKTVKPVGRIDYKYDLNGNRTKQVRTGTAGNDVTEYEYDDADQLEEEELEGPSHERETEYKYDARGNQIKAGGDKLEYNLDNTLAKATLASGQSTTFDYDAGGLRISSSSAFQGRTTTQRWTWDVAGTLPQIAIDTTEQGGAVTEKRAFTYGPDDEPLALIDPASGVHAYTHDWLGGTANVLSPSGTPEKAYDYDPFGNPRVGPTVAGQALPAESIENPLQYTGAYQDSTSGSGNYFMRARNYDPGNGRFDSRDPMPTGQGATSAYTYAANNPVAFSDPTGLMPDAGPTTTAGGTTPAATTGPSPEDLAKANQLQSKSTLDVILEAGGQILMEFLGINDILNCLKGDLVACVSMVVGALPWGKIFKAKKIGEAIFKAGKAVVTFFQELKWAKAIIKGAEDAAKAAKEAAAAAAKAAADKAAAAKAAAERAAKKAAAEAQAKAKALAAKAKAKTKKDAGDGGACPIPHSFVAGTTVLMADGTSKPIEEVEPGDTVRATDPSTGETSDQQVTHTIRTDDDKEFVDVTVASDDTSSTITTTEHHPFWSETRKQWVDAGDLREGELLRTAAGTYVQVSAVRSYQHKAITYDLTVDELHTYFVLAGDQPVLVHNVNCGDADALPRDRPTRRAGILDTGVDEVPFVSGPARPNPADRLGGYADQFADGPNRLPGMTDQNYHHVEMQAAAYMRQNGLSSGSLYMDSGPIMCSYCMGGRRATRDAPMTQGPISDLLPEGATLTVLFPKYGPFTFIGNAL